MLVLGSGFRSNQAHLRLVCSMVCRNKKAPGRRLFVGYLAGQNIPDRKPPKIFMDKQIKHLGFNASF